jgi:hypothetical protein
MYTYLQSLIWKEEEKEIQVDEKQKRLKYLTCEIIKKSNFKLKPINPPKKPLLHTRPKRPMNLHTIL